MASFESIKNTLTTSLATIGAIAAPSDADKGHVLIGISLSNTHASNTATVDVVVASDIASGTPAYALASNVVTVTATNTLAVGDTVYIDFSAPSSGATLTDNIFTVASATSSNFTVSYTSADSAGTSVSDKLTYIAKNVQIPVGGSIELLSGKIVLVTGDQIWAKYTSGTVDFVLSYLQDAAA